MRVLPLIAVLTGFLCLPCTLLLAQGEFALKYVDVKPQDPVLVTSRRADLSREKPPALKALPKGLSEQVRYCVIPIAGRRGLAVLETAKPLKLYVDTAGTGDLSAAVPLAGAASAGTWEFGPADLPTGSPRGAKTVKVRFEVPKTMAQASFGSWVEYSYVRFWPAGCMAGEVELAGESYPVALLDNNLDGRYEVAGGTLDTLLRIDLDRDGRIEPYFSYAGEVWPLRPMIQVKGVYYRVTVAPDGSSIRFEKAEPAMGTLEVGSADVSLVLDCAVGLERLTAGPGKWQVPAGECDVELVTLTRTDKAGATWVLRGVPGSTGGLRGREVRPGGTLALKVGAPLVVKVNVSDRAAGVKAVSVLLNGSAGEQYSAGIEKNGERRPPPSFRIRDESGKVVVAANFEYG